MLTRCPHCQTTFRIRPEHLKQAGGKVRCGQCQQIFDASVHLVEDEPAPAPRAKPRAPEPTPPPSYDEEKMEFIDLSATPAPGADDTATPPAETPARSAPEPFADETSRFNDLDAMGPIAIPGQLNMSVDESPADEDSFDDSLLLDEEISPDNDRRSYADEEAQDKPASDEELERLTAMISEVDKQLLEEDEAQAAIEASERDQATADRFESGEEPALAAQEISAQPSPPVEEDKETEPLQLESATPQLDDSMQGIQIDDAVPYALRKDLLKAQRPRRHWALTALYAVLALTLLAALAAQIMMFRNAELANRWPALRPVLSEFCQYLPCYYAGPRDIKQIALVSRDVRSHPTAKNALLISATIVNNASFSQPYPNILITLSDLSGTVVARREFRPPEYLNRVYNRFVLMEPNTPVHIELAVLDPGDDAVNFEFEFL